ncbi:MAG: DMT family transporter [Chloroflexota bacterium]|nr:DMT family transporter [Chloroflexota bacterium]
MSSSVLRHRSSVKPYLILAIGILAVSSSAFLITFARADGMPAVAIAALRLTLASLVLAPVALTRARGEWRRLARREWALAILSGISLALHFAFWISSLDYTSVMSSIVFVSTNPLFVGLTSVLILRESLRRGTIIGIALAALGGAVVGLNDLGQAGAESLHGDALALAGAVAVSGYLLIGRRLRKQLSLVAYIGVVYSTAAIVLLALAAAMGVSLLGYSARAYVLIALLAAGPQLIGHSAYNWALKYLSATFITVTILAEPIGATLLAIPILAQIPSPIKLAGGALILIGIYFAAREEYQ